MSRGYNLLPSQRKKVIKHYIMWREIEELTDEKSRKIDLSLH